ncbi:MAG: cytochrome c3 family protein [Phycisphaerales bacterium]
MNRAPAIIRLRAYLRSRRRVAAVCVGGVAVLAGCAAVLLWRLPRERPSAPVFQPAAARAVDPGVRPSREVTFREGCSTGGCHGVLTSWAVVHAPTAHGACDACHGPDAGGHRYPLVRGKAQLCTACHDTGGHELFQHKAMSEDACLACHDPHGGPTGAMLRSPTVQATCAKCHPAISGSETHKPYGAGACDACHDPHGADNSHLLVGGVGPDLCKRCHAPTVVAMETAAHTHGTVKGGCAACHGAHASNFPGLLHAPAREVCVSCHREVGDTVAHAAVSHDPVLKDKQCVTCHDPHASDHPKMLRGSQAQVCLTCHDKSLRTGGGRVIAAMGELLTKSPVVHGAVAHGDCAACHSVHGASHERLLKQLTPDVLPDPYDASNYAMCFSCHDRNIAGPGSVTQFRDGAKNLHAAHLKAGEKSRGCSACHSVHASQSPRLIATTVRYEGGEWDMPMRFTLTPTGGSCAPGCHERMSYDRSAPRAVDTNRNGGAP